MASIQETTSESNHSDSPIQVSIVFPCLNEESSVGTCIRQAQDALQQANLTFEIIVVDNKSTDKSVSIARECGATVVKENKRGYGRTLRKGIDAAQGEVVLMADADGTYELSKIPEFAAPILTGDCDLVMGNRFADIKQGAMPTLHRYIGNPVLSWMLRLMFRTHVRDVHCGMRAFAKKAYNRLNLVTTGMEFASEMIIRSVYHHLRIQEVDISYHPRIGESKLRTIHDGWRHLRLMLIYSPNVLFLLPATFFWVLGALVMTLLYPGPLWLIGRWFDVHSMLVGAIMNLVGLQLGIAGVIAKAYGHFSGLRRDRLIQVWSGRTSLEYGIGAASLLGLVSLGFIAYVFLSWVGSGFGDLMHTRELLLGLVLVCNAVAIFATSFILSLMVIPHSNEFQPYPDALTPTQDNA